MAPGCEALFHWFTDHRKRLFPWHIQHCAYLLSFNDTHSVPLSVSTATAFSLTTALFHKPLLEKQPQPHFSQLSNDTASHNAQANINSRYTINGMEITVAVGKIGRLLSWYQFNKKAEDWFPVICISGELSKPWATAANKTPSASTVKPLMLICRALKKRHCPVWVARQPNSINQAITMPADAIGIWLKPNSNKTSAGFLKASGEFLPALMTVEK